MFQKILERLANATLDTQYLRERISCKVCFTREYLFMDCLELANRVKLDRN
jgi:hypothetical protein